MDRLSQDLIDEFWSKCGFSESFPRDLERPLAFALPVALVKMPILRLHNIELWLQNREISFTFDCESRAVRGCLIAFRGQGVIFLDGSDPEDEQRFTLAHEIAHFMVDYLNPRRTAISRLGLQIAEAIDGIRIATVTERIHGIFGNGRFGLHTDLMERNERMDEISGTLHSIEGRADKIALALLAPPDIVISEADMAAEDFNLRDQSLFLTLREKYGLPAGVARQYSRILLAEAGMGRTWVEMIGLR